MFNINFKDIVKKLTPSFLRQTKRLEFLYSLTRPLKWLNSLFVQWKKQIDYELFFNGQTLNLEHVLNDTFDATSRGIYIQDTSVVSYTYVANKVESSVTLFLANKSETSVPPVYLENRSEQVSETHFIVMVPALLVYNDTEMRALINKYKIAAKNYTIQTY